MAVQIVDCAYTATANVATFDITLPAGLQEGDLVVVAVCNTSDASDTHYPVTTSGYTEVVDLYSNDTRDLNATISYKYMGGTPDTIVTCTGRTGSADYGCFGLATVLRGVRAVNPFDVPTVTATGINSALPDPPSITPLTLGSRVLIFGFSTQENDDSITAPTGYLDSTYVRSSVQYGGLIMAACKLWSGSGAEDPGAWTDINTSALESWAAATMVLHPESCELGVVLDDPVEAFVTSGGGTVVLAPSTEELLIQALGGPGAFVLAPPIEILRLGGNNRGVAVLAPEIEILKICAGGQAILLDLPEQLLASAYPGVLGQFLLEDACSAFLAQGGGKFQVQDIADVLLCSGTVGNTARFFLNPGSEQLTITGVPQVLGSFSLAPPIERLVMTAGQDVRGDFTFVSPCERFLATGYVGTSASFVLSPGAEEVLLTAFQSTTGTFVLAPPIEKLFFEATQSGRFDTATAAQLANVILKYRRPV
jgi:hypothetical protein